MSVTDSGSGGPMIEASGLSKYYGPFVAVHDISFVIPQGQVVAFLGPNGAGKTTLMRMLTGYLAPSAGSASIAGFDVRTDRIEASPASRLSARERSPVSGHDAAGTAHLLR